MTQPNVTAHGRVLGAMLIWGGGGHGKVVADVVRALGGEVTGFIDRDPAKVGQVVEPGGARVVLAENGFLGEIALGSDESVRSVALAIGDNAARLTAFARVQGVDFPVLAHPTAACSPSATFGAGTVVFAQAVVNAAAALGRAVIVNSSAVIEHDCVLEDGAHVSPGAVLSGGVRVGARSWIGAGATVIQGVTIGADVIVGAGAVVIRDVPDGVTVVGTPARVLAVNRR
ncbi:MAG: acetyltransferase [Candidatus Eremiobacteraeota bacterium]|nr:acetyltransferase [Candidatus Eremiobacteraeota bacterium]